VKQEAVEAMVAWALAVAGEADDYRNRELGPIHLLKYLYLGDLAFAEENAARTFSEVPWQFYRFGPWSAELYEQLPRAAEDAGARARRFQSPYREDAVRWRLPEPTGPDELASHLPPSVARAIRQAVKAYHNDTYSLLHFVYRTSPMLNAAPGELLVFHAREESTNNPIMDESPALRTISKTQLKRIKEKVRSLLADRREHRKTISPKINYDADYFEILDLLDREVGEPTEQTTGILEFSAAVWKSEARRGSEIP
jgi:hypothetical protein